ncbi:hypothetical protein [Streptomyces puniciscabiei]|uniref:hypothetical protein n=1 Tax=Streptomyces puniciscabiei TaxID=164348 RepID=UPI003EBAA781
MVALLDGAAEPGGQQVQQVVPVDGEAVRVEAAGEFGGGAVVARADARGDDRDPAGGRRPAPGARYGAHGCGHGKGASGVGHGLVLRPSGELGLYKM